MQRDGRSEEARRGNAERVVADRRQQFRSLCGKCGATRQDSQFGLEPTPEEYVAALVDVFREVRRVLRSDGTVWLNLGDTYHGGGGGNYGDSKSTRTHAEHLTNVRNRSVVGSIYKPKDLVGIPWRVAFALQADGWYLRSDIIWSKPNPMPESVTDRPTKSHEYVFLLSKSARYWFDADAVREEPQHDFGQTWERRKALGHPSRYGMEGVEAQSQIPLGNNPAGRNIRSVWTIATAPYPGAHFATFPPKLVEPCIKAGCPEGGTVLDPFAGTGTVGLVAQRLSRRAVLIDLNAEYLAQCLARNAQTPMGLVS